MPKTKTAATKSICQLKVTLVGTEPPIWRRLQVPGNVTLRKLAAIINTAMGWQSYHLHEFHLGKEVWGVRTPAGDDVGYEVNDDRKSTLAEVAPRRSSEIRYTYDIGDGWLHRVVVERIVDPQPKQHYPACLEGQRACPPEDCGGIPGFYNLLDVLGDPKHPDHEGLSEWVGGKFDAEAFDLEETNKALHRIR